MEAERIPVIIGVGQVNDRPTDAAVGCDSEMLMERALRTADIDRVRWFYVDVLGFDVVSEARDVPGWGTTGDILFVSAGGYHHHLGFNTWKSAGGGPQPDGVALIPLQRIDRDIVRGALAGQLCA